MSEQVKQLFTEIAPRYDQINSLLSLKVDQLWRRAAIKHLTGDRYRQVLDLCAGTLAMTQQLLQVNLDCHVTAVDFSETMLQIGLKKLPYGDLSRVKIQNADAMQLPFPPQSFDGIMCAYGMRNLDDNRRALEGIFRLLKPGGKLVVLDFFAPDRWASRLFYATYGHFFIPMLGRLLSRHRNAYEYLQRSIQGFYTPVAYAELLKLIGFQNVAIKRQTGGISCLLTAERGNP